MRYVSARARGAIVSTVAVTSLLVLAAIPASTATAITLTNGALTVDIRADNGAIGSVTFGGANFYDQGTYVSDWGLQNGTDQSTFALNTTQGVTGIPVTVTTPSGSVQVSGTYTGGGANVAFTRTYSLVAGLDVLRVATQFLNAGSAVTVSYFDTFDPDQGIDLGLGFSTYNDVLGNVARASATSDLTVVMGSQDAGVTLAAGNPFQISTGSLLNSFFASPFDGNGTLADAGLHVGLRFSLAPAESRMFTYDQAYGTSTASALDAFSDANACGNGTIEAGETCDDGGVTAGDGCDATCQIEAGYDCTGAPSVCSAICGDGLIVGAEACDDGGTTPGDGCDATCQIETGYSCTGAPSACSAICGDGLIVGTEACDDGGVTAGDGCDATCQVESGYTCTGAPSVCSATCGDGLIVDGETCDDGGVVPGDGCNASCQTEDGWSCSGAPSTCTAICGDGLIVGGEGCDDGGTTPGDGCDGVCQTEAGWACTGSPSTCTETCGDGVITPGESCDDGNVTSGDGCSASCEVECRCTCTGEPSACTCSQLIPALGLKLIVLDQLQVTGKAKTVFIAKDPAITKGAGTDPASIGIEFTAAYSNVQASGSFIVPAGDAGWLANNDHIAKFVNKAAPSGTTETRVSILKPGKLVKLVGKGLGDTPLNIVAAGAPLDLHTAYCMTNGGEEFCYCSTFVGCSYTPIAGGTVAKVECRHSQADATCAAICQ